MLVNVEDKILDFLQVRRGLTTSEAVAVCSEEDSSIIACAFTASSKNVAWATESNQIKMTLTSGEVATVGSHVGSMINIMKFGPKGKVLATVGKDGTMMLWTRAKDKDQESKGSPCFVSRAINIPRLEVFQFYFVSHSTDGSSIWSCGSNKKDDLSVLVVHSDGTAKVWLCASGKLVDTKFSNLAFSITACDISFCNMYLAMGDETGGLRQFRLQEPKISISLATHANKDMVVSACRYSPDVNFHYLAVGYNSGAFELWDFADRKLLHMLNFHSSAVKDILFATSNPKIIVSNSDRIALWNLAESGRKKPKTYNKKSWSPMPEVKTFEFNSCILPVQTVELPCTGTTIKIRGNADLSTLVAMTDLGSIYKLKHL
ncbi:hypothetical protein QYM36_010147 [Artemia franciscana]|uniref:Uncharacterized protein n=1 Tax=Artemia franciscana TaxID=6661 RepID=A0AA88HWP3_ARTSF|nr:hypothetical protein QYM36_010147 [Artemia franciscana]